MSYCLRRYIKTVYKLSKHRFWLQNLKPCSSSSSSGSPTLDQMTSMSIQSETEAIPHIPVMTNEVVDILAPVSGQTIIDMTFGAGGHTRVILRRAPGVKMVAVDRDPLAYKLCKSLTWEPQGQSIVIPVLGKFSELHQHLQEENIEEGSVDGVLFDLGASSMQFDTAQRGFSLSRDGPLDMRMDGNRFPDLPTAADIVNHLDATELAMILKHYGEERHAHAIAQAIVEARYAFGNIRSTMQLAQIVDTVFEASYKQDKLQRHAHTATKVFQALRIFVNNELNELHNGLEVAWRYLRPGGRCVVLSFHSLEDRIVKRHFHGIQMEAKANMRVADHHRNSVIMQPLHALEQILGKKWAPVSKKVMTPSLEELSANPRSRSAKLRAATKL